MMVCALMGICACGSTGYTGSRNSGKVNGSFTTEATTFGEIEEAAGNINLGKAFGNREDEKWAFGLELSESFVAKIDLHEEEQGAPETVFNIEGNESADYVLNLTREDMKGSGAAEARFHAKVPIVGGSVAYRDTSCSLALDLYNDVNNLYAKFVSLNVNGEDRLKDASDGDVLESLFEGLIESNGADLPSLIPEWDNEEGSLADLLEMLRTQYGAKLYFDTSKGVSVKVCFDARQFLEYVLQFISLNVNLDYFNFTKDTADAYFAFDEEGLFQKFGFELDINAALKRASEENAAYNGTISLNGHVAVITSDKKAATPKDLTAYPYVIPISVKFCPTEPAKDQTSHVIIDMSTTCAGLASFTSSVEDAVILFAPPEGYHSLDSYWLKFDGEAREDLTVSFKFTYRGELSSLNLSIEGLDALLPYLGSPCLYVNGADVGFAGSDGNIELPVKSLPAGRGTITVTAVFPWGEKFDGKNPYDYFNALPFSSENAALANQFHCACRASKHDGQLCVFRGGEMRGVRKFLR